MDDSFHAGAAVCSWCSWVAGVVAVDMEVAAAAYVALVASFVPVDDVDMAAVRSQYQVVVAVVTSSCLARVHHDHQVEMVIVIAVHGLALFVVHARIVAVVAVERDVGPDYFEGNWIYLHVLAGVVVEEEEVVAVKIAEAGNGALAHQHDDEVVEVAVVSSSLVVLLLPLLRPSSSYLEVVVHLHDGASSQAQQVSVHHVVDHLDGS